MSQLGQTRKLPARETMSADPSEADIPNPSLCEQAVALRSAPIMEFRRSAFAPKADVEATKQPSRCHHPDC